MWGGGGTEGEGEKGSNSVVVFSRAVGKEDMGFRRPPLHCRPAGRGRHEQSYSCAISESNAQPLAIVIVASQQKFSLTP